MDDSPQQNYMANMIDERSGSAFRADPEGGQEGRNQVGYSSVYNIMCPQSVEHEVIVDFELIPALSQGSSPHIVFSTNTNDVHLRDLGNPDFEECLCPAASKCLVPDHYIDMLHYFKQCDKLFAVSQLRPDILYAE